MGLSRKGRDPEGGTHTNGSTRFGFDQEPPDEILVMHEDGAASEIAAAMVAVPGAVSLHFRLGFEVVPDTAGRESLAAPAPP